MEKDIREQRNDHSSGHELAIGRVWPDLGGDIDDLLQHCRLIVMVSGFRNLDILGRCPRKDEGRPGLLKYLSFFGYYRVLWKTCPWNTLENHRLPTYTTPIYSTYQICILIKPRR